MFDFKTIVCNVKVCFPKHGSFLKETKVQCSLPDLGLIKKQTMTAGYYLGLSLTLITILFPQSVTSDVYRMLYVVKIMKKKLSLPLYENLSIASKMKPFALVVELISIPIFAYFLT